MPYKGIQYINNTIRHQVYVYTHGGIQWTQNMYILIVSHSLTRGFQSSAGLLAQVTSDPNPEWCDMIG